MDFQRDYILRLIQMMGDLMRRILEQLEEKQRLAMLSDACRELCGLTLDAAVVLDDESLQELLAPMPRLMMSELLFIRAQTCATLPADVASLQLKALRLLASLHGEPQLCELRAARLTQLMQAVFDQLTAADLMACARFFSQAERFDAMEDALFQALALENGAAWEADRALAIALLRAAAKAPETSLALCGMTAQELRLSARELEQQRLSNEQENPQ